MTRALLALAAIAVVVIALRPRRPAPLPESDDIVGMPTTWRIVSAHGWRDMPPTTVSNPRDWRLH